MRVLQIIAQANYPNPLPCLEIIPQGAGYITAMMRKHNHEVQGVCTNYYIGSEPAPVVLHRKMMAKIAEFQPQVIVIGAMAPEFLFVRDAITMARKACPHVPIVLGGRIVTNDIDTFQMLSPDFGIIGEGEYSIVELLECLDQGKDYSTCKGIVFWRNGEPVITEARLQVDDLDDLPFPHYDILELHSHLEMQNQYDNYFHVRTNKNPRLIPLTAGRSCPFKCTFCQHNLQNGLKMKYRRRSVDNIIDEIVFMKEKYNFNIIKIYDDLFSVREDDVHEFCEKVKKLKFEFKWNASMRVNNVSKDLLKAMKAAGCAHIGYGLESMSVDVLQSMNKGIKPEQVIEAIKMTEEAGIGVQGNFIYGDPAETPETVAETVKFYKQYCSDFIIHNDYVMPYPGSPIFDYCLENNIINEKKNYYETIHLKPRYNMTKMSQKDFYHSIDKIVRFNIVGIKKANNVRFSMADRREFKHAYFDNKTILAAKYNCPHCGGENENIFPVPGSKPSSPEWQSRMMKPIRFFCFKCHKRLLISTLSILGFEEKFLLFLTAINNLINEKTPVVILPCVGKEMLEILMAYGLDFENLDIHSCLQPGLTVKGLEFYGVPVYSLSAPVVRRYSEHTYVVLPSAMTTQICEFLKKIQIPSERVISF